MQKVQKFFTLLKILLVYSKKIIDEKDITKY